MGMSDEFVRRLAAVECSEWAHPVRWERPNPRAAFGAPAPINMIDEDKALDAREAAELQARCPFCIARAALKSVADSDDCPHNPLGMHTIGCHKICDRCGCPVDSLGKKVRR